MPIVNENHIWCHKLEHHSWVTDHALRVINHAPRVVNYAPRVVKYAPRAVNYAPIAVNYAPRVLNYAPREPSYYWFHLPSSLMIDIYFCKTFIIQPTDLYILRKA